MSNIYNQGSRTLQDQFDSRRIADRLEQRTVHDTFTDEDRAFIERSPMFFLATADAEGHPECSYKGGMPGFVRVVNPSTLAFPDYDPLLSEYPGAQLIVRVQAKQIFPNCPRYIHKMHLIDYSKYAPRLDYTPPEPEWKQMEEFRDALPQPRGSNDTSSTNETC